MTPRISSAAFIGWRGRLHAAVRRIAKLPPRPRVSGEAWVMDAWQTNPEPIVTTNEFDYEFDADDELAVYRGMMDGSTYTAVDPRGQSWQVKVIAVNGEISQTTTGTFKLVATWNLQVEAAP